MQTNFEISTSKIKNDLSFLSSYSHELLIKPTDFQKCMDELDNGICYRTIHQANFNVLMSYVHC